MKYRKHGFGWETGHGNIPRRPYPVVALPSSSLSLSQARTIRQPKLGNTSSQTATQASSFTSDVSETLIDQRLSRTYYLHTPTADSPDHLLPLVVALHGTGMQGKEMADKTALNKLADQAGFVVVYPDGLNQKWNVSGKSAEDNVAFVHILINQVQKIRSLDAQRIYVVGLSNGGILAQKLACEDPSGIAANTYPCARGIATVAASLPNQFATQCQTQQPVSLLMVNGTTDALVPWQGGAAPDIRIGQYLSIPSIPTVLNFWQRHNACSSPPQSEQPSKLVEVTDYSCQAGTEVKLVALEGTGHVWAGGGYGQSAFGDTTARVWQFFQHHALTSSDKRTS